MSYTVVRQQVPGEAIRLHEARKAFCGWAATTAYKHFVTGEAVLPADVTAYELAKYKFITSVLTAAKKRGLSVPAVEACDSYPPDHLVKFLSEFHLQLDTEEISPWAPVDDGRHVN
ncbi:MAG: hypothetical protein P1U84_12065 [Parvibaculaceae bacterium]|nr:hypothetical protein [Parvibaculaceae bacterium]